MGNGYIVPPADEFAALGRALADVSQRLRELEAPDGSQLFNAVSELRNLVDNLATEIGNVAASGATWQGPVSAGSGHIVTTGGDFFTPHGRATPVVTSYVAAYINSDGRIGATVSAERFKQDIQPRVYTLTDIAQIQIIAYRLRTAVEELGPDAPSEVGVIAEQLAAAGFPEFVVYDDGEAFSVKYDRLALVALAGLQELAVRVAALEAKAD